LALLSLAGLLWLAGEQHSQSPSGVLGLFGFSLFISLGFLLFGRQSFPLAEQDKPSDTEHRA
jgi:hypothetical protein